MLACSATTHTHTHTHPFLESWHSASDTRPHFSHPWGERESWQPHIGHPGTMRQAGERLHDSSAMAGSAEGEALTPILMRPYAAQWPGGSGRNTRSYTREHSASLKTLRRSGRTRRRRSDSLTSLSVSIFSTFEAFWQIYCTPFHNNTSPTTTTHRSCYRRSNNRCSHKPVQGYAAGWAQAA